MISMLGNQDSSLSLDRSEQAVYVCMFMTRQGIDNKVVRSLTGKHVG